MERDAVGHLLLYEPSGADDLPKDKFIHAALARLGTGHHFYSRADENRLVAWCWLKDREGTLDLGHAGGEVPLPAGSAVMTGLAVSAAGHTSPDAYRAALAEVLNEAANIPQTQQVVLRVSRTSAGLCRAAESEGFTLWLRAFRRRILWRSRCWRTGPVGGFPDSAGPSAAAARGPSASDAAPTSSEV
jgi:hypothetical protein